MAKIFYITFIILGSVVNCFGQTASANISVTISHPVGTEKINDMDFGIFETGKNAGSIELNTSGNYKSSGGVILISNTTATHASLSITGDYAYSVTLPTDDIILKRDGGKETMTVGSFNITPTITKDNQLLAIGATLQVGASQLPGNYYLVDAFTVTVNYN